MEENSDLPPLMPPLRFSIVEAGVYRGAYPTLKNYRFLKRLALRTIISLVPEDPISDLVEFCRGEGVQLDHIVVPPFRDNVVFSPAQAASVLQRVIDPRCHPVYLHCLDGTHNTGLIVMCLRRLQNWSVQAIYREYYRYVDEASMADEAAFLEQEFRVEVSLPDPLPSWLWGGQAVASHPSLRLRYPRGYHVLPGPDAKLAADDVAAPTETNVVLSATLQALDLEMQPGIMDRG